MFFTEIFLLILGILALVGIMVAAAILVDGYEPKKTYLINWYVLDCPEIHGSDLVDARTKAKAWRKVQRKRDLCEIGLLQMKEIR